MAKRVCVKCGKEKEISGGKICEKKGHFVCRECVYEDSGIFTVREKEKCPVCSSKLR